jgi:predicted membrane-bound spermidine synthase
MYLYFDILFMIVLSRELVLIMILINENIPLIVKISPARQVLVLFNINSVVSIDYLKLYYLSLGLELFVVNVLRDLYI